MGLLIPKKTKKVGIMCLFALVLSVIFNNLLLKNLVGRARPFETLSSIIPLIAENETGKNVFLGGHDSRCRQNHKRDDVVYDYFSEQIRGEYILGN